MTGPRQSGKSTLIQQAFPTHAYVSFDDPLNCEQAARDPELLLNASGERLVLDEIQYVPHLLSYLKIRIDRQREGYGRYVLTGSQQFPLIKSLGDSLAGRVGILELLPLDLAEATPRLDATSDLDRFLHACLRGLYPEPVVRADLPVEIWYSAYLRTYLERDVRGLSDIGNLHDYQRFMQLLASRCSQELHFSGLSRDLGVAPNTVRRWFSILEASRLVYPLSPYYRNQGKRIMKAPRVYFTDCGLVCHLVGIRSREHLLRGPMAGALFENFVVQETLKAFLHAGRPPRLYYLRTHNGVEADLLIEGDGQTLHPVEIKLNQTPRPEDARPMAQLKTIFDRLEFEHGQVVCLAERDEPLTREAFVRSPSAYLQWLRNTVARPVC